MRKLKLSLGLLMILFFQACVSLKPYEFVYVKDPEMQMGSQSAKNFQDYVQAIRSGTTPARAVKASGGCGCN